MSACGRRVTAVTRPPRNAHADGGCHAEGLGITAFECVTGRTRLPLRLLMMWLVQGDLHQPCTPSGSFGGGRNVRDALSVLACLIFRVAALARSPGRSTLTGCTRGELAALMAVRAHGAVLVARRLDAHHLSHACQVHSCKQPPMRFYNNLLACAWYAGPARPPARPAHQRVRAETRVRLIDSAATVARQQTMLVVF